MCVHVCVCEGQLKSSLADQDTLIECDQIRFIFQHCSLCDSHISSIGVAVLGSHWSKKLSTADITSSNEFFSPPSYIYIYIYIYIYTCLIISIN